MLPELTSFSPVNVCVSSSLTSVLDDASCRRRSLVVVTAAGGDDERERREQRQQEGRAKAGHREELLSWRNWTAAGCVAAGGKPAGRA